MFKQNLHWIFASKHHTKNKSLLENTKLNHDIVQFNETSQKTQSCRARIHFKKTKERLEGQVALVVDAKREPQRATTMLR